MKRDVLFPNCDFISSTTSPDSSLTVKKKKRKGRYGNDATGVLLEGARARCEVRGKL